MGTIIVEAARADRFEAGFWAQHARNIMTSDATRDTGAVSVAGGYALYLQGTELAYALAVGSTRPLRDDDVHILDEFYSRRDLPARLELHPAVAERDAGLLSRWGYVPDGEIAVLEREIGSGLAVPDHLRVETMTGRRSDWVDVVVEGSLDRMPSLDRPRLERSIQAAATAASVLVGVRIDGRLVGGAALGVIGDAAFLLCGATLPAFRRRGVHQALIAGRLRAATERGATFAFMRIAPESPAIQSAEHAGFVVSYVRRRVRKP